MLVAQIRNGFAFNQMLAKNRDFLLRTKVTSVVVVYRGLFFRPRLAYPQLKIFQFRLKHDKMKSGIIQLTISCCGL